MDLVILLAGIAAASVGGELFVRGAVGVADWARVPSGVIGVTIAAFATSSPELSVGVQSAITGEPAIALGDALGSNVINIGLVLGVTLVFGAIAVRPDEVRRELLVAAAAPMLTLAALVDGTVVRAEALVLLAAFVGWMVLVTRSAMRTRSEVVELMESSGPDFAGRSGVSLVAGLLLLVLAGRLVVTAAKGIGADLGLDPFVVGATLVAFGTSTPELATAIISRARGHADIGVGTVLGSNVFNNLWIVGVAGVIEPIDAVVSEALLAVAAVLVALLLIVPRHGRPLGRSRGFGLLAVTVAYGIGTIALA